MKTINYGIINYFITKYCSPSPPPETTMRPAIPYNISYYKNVMIIWDDDFDNRITLLLDKMDTTGLYVIHEHKNELYILHDDDFKYDQWYEFEIEEEFWIIKEKFRADSFIREVEELMPNDLKERLVKRNKLAGVE